MALFGLVRGFAAFMSELVKSTTMYVRKELSITNLGGCQSPKSVTHSDSRRSLLHWYCTLMFSYSLDLAAFG